MEEVEAASRLELAWWYRFLRCPGANAIDKPAKEFYTIMEAEQKIVQRVSDRFKELGGMSPAISKQIGWDPC